MNLRSNLFYAFFQSHVYFLTFLEFHLFHAENQFFQARNETEYCHFPRRRFFGKPVKVLKVTSSLANYPVLEKKLLKAHGFLSFNNILSFSIARSMCLFLIKPGRFRSLICLYLYLYCLMPLLIFLHFFTVRSLSYNFHTFQRFSSIYILHQQGNPFTRMPGNY